MPIDLSEMLSPRAAAVLTMEVQGNTVGDLTSLPELRKAVEEEGMLNRIRELLIAARRGGVPVVHCTVGPDFVAGIPPNYPGAAAIAKRTAGAAPRPGATDPVPDIGVAPQDLVMRRRHGISPFTGTDLDALLRRLGVRTIVACGVSLNVGILGLTIEAVGLGYRVAVVTDAVAGVPVEYGRAVIQNSLPFIATRLTVADVAAVWDGGTPG
jgi:nicotinamidase-related amidase